MNWFVATRVAHSGLQCIGNLLDVTEELAEVPISWYDSSFISATLIFTIYRRKSVTTDCNLQRTLLPVFFCFRHASRIFCKDPIFQSLRSFPQFCPSTAWMAFYCSHHRGLTCIPAGHSIHLGSDGIRHQIVFLMLRKQRHVLGLTVNS